MPLTKPTALKRITGIAAILNAAMANLRAVGLDPNTLRTVQQLVDRLDGLKLTHGVEDNTLDKMQRAAETIAGVSDNLKQMHLDVPALKAVGENIERSAAQLAAAITEFELKVKVNWEGFQEGVKELKQTKHDIKHEVDISDKSRDNLIIVIATILVAALAYKAAPYVLKLVKTISQKLYGILTGKQDTEQKKKAVARELQSWPAAKLVALKDGTMQALGKFRLAELDTIAATLDALDESVLAGAVDKLAAIEKTAGVESPRRI